MASPGKLVGAARDALLDQIASHLDHDRAVAGWGLVGSFGRGTHDEWSDLDVLVVLDGEDVGPWCTPGTNDLWATADLVVDARRNAPDTARSMGTLHVVHGLPVGIDWYVYPATTGAWPVDCDVRRDRVGLPRLTTTFTDWNAVGPRGVSVPISAAQRARARLAMVPIAAKYLARSSDQALPMLRFLEAEPTGSDPASMLAALHRRVDRVAVDSPPSVVRAVEAHLSVVARHLGEQPSPDAG